MAMLSDFSMTSGELRSMFNSARERNQRYFAVIEQVIEDRYMVTVSQGSFVTSDAAEIVRNLRETGLRPGAFPSRLRYVFDTRAGFEAQLKMGRDAMLAANLPTDVKAAYERYQQDLAAQKQRAANANKGLFARLFGKT